MKQITNNRCTGLSTMALALGASLMITLSSAVAIEEAGNYDKGFLGKMEQWQNKMSDKFRDTWKSLRGDDKGKSVATASVDLREDSKSYTLRLSLPDRDLENVEIKLDGDTLRIVAPVSGQTGYYEQTVVLGGVASGAQPKVERKQKDHLIVVTVPKGSSAADSKPSPTLPKPPILPFSDWDRDIFARMEKMRREMDRVFEDAFQEFRGAPEHKGFFDEPRFGSAVDLKEEGDNYVVRAYLPERDMQNINVTVEARTLKIEAKEQAMTKKEGEGGVLHSSRTAAYSQFLTLPGPVQSEKMQIEKKDGLVVVTLPKSR